MALNINLVKLLDGDYIIVLITTANKEEAEEIAKTLLKENLIACANVVNPIKSFFNWTDKINEAEECLVVMKSRMELFSELSERVRCLHSYAVPEILALPLIDGSKDYLNWMSKALK